MASFSSLPVAKCARMCGNGWVDEKIHRLKYDVCEIFSVPRVTQMAKDMGMRAGWALDITESDGITKRSYDLSSSSDQRTKGACIT